MKNYCMVLLWCISTVSMASQTVASGSLIPGATDGLYYKIGGGRVTPLPLAKDKTDIHVNVGGNAGLGYNCGIFNPGSSIVNSLNDVDGSFGRITTQLYNSATGMLMSLPAYILAKTMPEVYKLMQDGMSNGQFDFDIASKSCQRMMSDIGRGKSPYNDWMQASMGDAWKYNMSLADTDLVKDGVAGSDDINQANLKINQANGKEGVAWVRGVSRNGDHYAGGQNQPVILLTQDTVIAGYNVLVGQNRAYDDTSTPTSSDNNQRLLQAFATPQAASEWVANVVGEQTISTYAGGEKKSTPGLGLLGEVQTQTDILQEKLSGLVDGSIPITIENLNAVSPPKILLNKEVIETLQKQDDDLMRAIYVNKLAQEIASARTIDKAKLGLECLEVGAQVPEIMNNGAAQSGILQAKTRLRAFIQDLRENPQDNEMFVGKTLVALMQESKAKDAENLNMRPSSKTPAPLQDGAIATGDLP